MKNKVLSVASVFILYALVIGCSPNPTTPVADSAGSLSADELALLLDFHVWNQSVPQSQQPLKRVKLVLVRADGTTAELFGTAYSDSAPAWTNILLGFRHESGKFAGRLALRGPKMGMGDTYEINFVNASTEYPRSWYGACLWKGARGELATFWNDKEAAKRGGRNDYSTLVIELVK